MDRGVLLMRQESGIRNGIRIEKRGEVHMRSLEERRAQEREKNRAET